MKHKLLPLLLILLCACSSNTTTLTVNDPLSYSVRIKDNAEFILVKEGTSIEDFNDILLDNLDIDTNADTYDVDWWGEAYAGYVSKEELNNDLKNYEENKSTDEYLNDEAYYMEDFGDLELAKENTLNHDSIRPIKLVIKFYKDDEDETYYKRVLLCVAKETEYNVLKNLVNKSIENAYINIYKEYIQTNKCKSSNCLLDFDKFYLDESNGYRANLRMHWTQGDIYVS